MDARAKTRKIDSDIRRDEMQGCTGFDSEQEKPGVEHPEYSCSLYSEPEREQHRTVHKEGVVKDTTTGPLSIVGHAQ